MLAAFTNTQALLTTIGSCVGAVCLLILAIKSL